MGELISDNNRLKTAPPADNPSYRFNGPMVADQLAGPLGQHRPPEELRRGAPLPGVYDFPAGHDADVAPGQLRLNSDAVLKVSGEPIEEGCNYGVSLLDSGHQFLPAGTLQIAAAGHVGIDQVGPDAVLGQDHELGVQILGLVVGLADAGIPVGDCNQYRGLSTGWVFRKRAFVNTSRNTRSSALHKCSTTMSNNSKR